MTTHETVPQLLTELDGKPPEEVLAVAAERFEGRVAFATSLGPEDQVITHMLAEAGIDMRVFTLDTGRLFPETYDLIARTSDRYGISIYTYFPYGAAVEEMVGRHGINLFRTSIELRKMCCGVRKVRPLRRAQSDLDAWVCGLRSGQGATRQKVEPVEWDDAGELIKFNPLADWDEERVWRYVRAHDIPYNPLHDQGFPSIGCAPCTRAVAPGEDFRAGRWWWEDPDQRECGLHHRTGAADRPVGDGA
ncbi:MAG: phosphoadenylyl-sulfate reductase [Thermoleophilia bacterium]|nr:phosphoadenylyl-sulfate reductase [Thermoleophilia bacterium]